MNRQFIEQKIQIALRHLKRWLDSVILRESKLKLHCFVHTGQAKFTKFVNTVLMGV